MKELFDKFLMYFCFAGIGTIAIVAFVRVTLPAAATKARGMARKARKAGPAVIIPILCIAGVIVYGSTKSNSPTNDPPAQTQMIVRPGQLVEQRFDKIASEVVEASSVQKVGEAALQSVASMEPPASNALVRVEKWWRRGAYDDGQILTFDEDWCLPYGTNHLTRVEVWASGAVYASMKAPNPIVELVTKLSVAPQDTEVYMGRTTTNTYRIEWHGGHPNRDPNQTADASIELFRNGKIIVTEGGVETLIPYEPPFEHVGYGQNDDWVRANFTNAEEIISIGYANWVDQQVGVGLTNGLYKFTAEFLDDPPEPTELYIGDYSVCVTNAGEYVFVLEKGEEYEFGTWPFSDDIDYWAQDDLAADAPMLTAWWGGWVAPGEWTVDGGWNWFSFPSVYYGRYYNGYCAWCPILQGSPDVSQLGGSDFPKLFSAVVSDYPNPDSITYEWHTSDANIHIMSPHARETLIAVDSMPTWDFFDLSVSTIINGLSYVSSIRMGYGKSDTSHVALSLDMPETLVVNGSVGSCADADLVPVQLRMAAESETNGLIRVYVEGGASNVRFWNDPNRDGESTNVCELSVCNEASHEYTFYVEPLRASEEYFGESIVAQWTSASGVTRSVTNRFTVVSVKCEPICDETTDDAVVNPCAIVKDGVDAEFRIDVTPSSYPADLIRWSSSDEQIRFETGCTGRVIRLSVASGELPIEEHTSRLEVVIGTVRDNAPCFTVTSGVSKKIIKLRQYLVVDESLGVDATTYASLQDLLPGINKIFSQVGVRFELGGDLVVIPNNDYLQFDVREGRLSGLLDEIGDREGISIFFVDRLTDKYALKTIAGYCAGSCILVSSSLVTDQIIAHELGHSAGLMDIYPQDVSNTDLAESVSESSMPEDWGSCGHTGFYSSGLLQCDLIRRLLMCGVAGPDHIDIPHGRVRGYRHVLLHNGAAAEEPRMSSSIERLRVGLYDFNPEFSGERLDRDDDEE